jgi:hypothetical protein
MYHANIQCQSILNSLRFLHRTVLYVRWPLELKPTQTM